MLWAFVARKEESWSYQFFFLWNVCCNNNSGNNFESTNYEKVKKSSLCATYLSQALSLWHTHTQRSSLWPTHAHLCTSAAALTARHGAKVGNVDCGRRAAVRVENEWERPRERERERRVTTLRFSKLKMFVDKIGWKWVATFVSPFSVPLSLFLTSSLSIYVSF